MKDAKEIAIVIIAIILLAFFFAYGLNSETKVSKDTIEDAKKACLIVCKTTRASKTDGPCLTDHLAPDWVCDIAHSPRQATDDNPDNQCPSYIEGKSHHFVEVTPSCKFIRAI